MMTVLVDLLTLLKHTPDWSRFAFLQKWAKRMPTLSPRVNTQHSLLACLFITAIWEVITTMLQVSSKLYHPQTRLITWVQRRHNKMWLNQSWAGLWKIGSPHSWTRGSLWAAATAALYLTEVFCSGDKRAHTLRQWIKSFIFAWWNKSVVHLIMWCVLTWAL